MSKLARGFYWKGIGGYQSPAVFFPEDLPNIERIASQEPYCLDRPKIISIPNKRLSSGIRFAEANDLKKIFKEYNLKRMSIHFPNSPFVFKGVDFLIADHGEFNVRKKVRPLNVFYCHGKDGKEDRNPPTDNWMLDKNAEEEFRNIPIPELVHLANKEVPIDIVLSCNKGAYEPENLKNILYRKQAIGAEIEITRKLREKYGEIYTNCIMLLDNNANIPERFKEILK